MHFSDTTRAVAIATLLLYIWLQQQTKMTKICLLTVALKGWLYHKFKRLMKVALHCDIVFYKIQVTVTVNENCRQGSEPVTSIVSFQCFAIWAKEKEKCFRLTRNRKTTQTSILITWNWGKTMIISFNQNILSLDPLPNLYDPFPICIHDIVNVKLECC